MLSGDEQVGKALPPRTAGFPAPGVGDVEPDERGLHAVTDADDGGLEVALGHLRVPRPPNLILPSLPHFIPRAECRPVCPCPRVQRVRNGWAAWWPQFFLPNMALPSDAGCSGPGRGLTSGRGLVGGPDRGGDQIAEVITG